MIDKFLVLGSPVHLLTEEYSMLSPAELEARGMNLPEKNLSAHSEISDAQQKLAGNNTVVKINSFNSNCIYC